MKAGAYEPEGRKYWSDEGWKYVIDCKVKAPRYWLTVQDTEVGVNRYGGGNGLTFVEDQDEKDIVEEKPTDPSAW
jgi:hypothetical protein